jgi:twinkle protein
MSIPLKWWPRFNELLGGLRMHELTVITAPTGSGKTTLTAQLVCQALLATFGSYICSAEIGNVLFMLAMLSAFDGKDLVRGDQHDPVMAAEIFERYRKIMRSSRLVFSRQDDRINPRTLVEELKRAHGEFGVRLAILDNLQFLLPTGSSDNQLSTTDQAIRDLVRFVRSTELHVILIAHPKKSSMGAGGRIESEESVKGSSSIYQECSNFIGISRLSDDLLRNPGFHPTDREMKFFKIRRRGANVGKSAYFEFNAGRYAEKLVEWRKPS